MTPFSETEIENLMQSHPLWRLEADHKAIVRDFVFDDFKQAFEFMSKIAPKADAMDHHPEWSNVYNRVTIRLTTHDAKGLSLRDAALATVIDTLV
jgi:4a-hydroxytetrahydrobiopterin dehydratase